MSKIKKVDFSQFAKKADDIKESIGFDNPLLSLAKSMIPSLPNKIKYIIALAVYLIIIGVLVNVYWIVKLIMFTLR